MRRTEIHLLLLLALLLGSATSGCATAEEPLDPLRPLWEPFQESSSQQELTEAQLQSDLAEFAARFSSVMGALGERITAEGASPEVRRRALLLRVQLVPLIQQHALERDARSAFVSLFSITVMLRRSVESEAGVRDFGPYQPLIQEAAHSLEQDLIALGRRFLDEERFDRLREEIESFAREHQTGNGFAVAQVEESLIEAQRSDRFGAILDLPLAPFRAFRGVEQGPAAIREFTQTARVFAAIVSTLPLQLRWQVELLLQETLQRQQIVETLAAIERVAASAERVSQMTERLPTELRRTIEAAEPPLQQLDTTLRRARSLAGPLESAAAEVANAGLAWGQLVDREPSAKEPDDGDLEAQLERWGALATRVGEAARSLEAATRSLQTLLEGQPGRSAEDASRQQGLDRLLRELTDHLISRVLFLTAALLALALLYRYLAARIVSRSKG